MEVIDTENLLTPEERQLLADTIRTRLKCCAKCDYEFKEGETRFNFELLDSPEGYNMLPFYLCKECKPIADILARNCADCKKEFAPNEQGWWEETDPTFLICKKCCDIRNFTEMPVMGEC